MKTIVYIDGQNFLYKVAEKLVEAKLVKDKQEVSAIDIPYLLKQVFPKEKMTIRFYGVAKIKQQHNFGKVILDKSVKFANNLRKIRNCLTKTGVEYRATGLLKVRDSDKCKKCGATDYKFMEKGVDVGLAVDIVRDVMSNLVDHIILLSSDMDIMPAILVAQEFGKKITYVGFNNRLTSALSFRANVTQVLRDDEVIEAWRRAKK
ncbi:MAG: NYN domain-containing protein [Candidatus Nomurabacteria bacterium]|nr:NYN domain-containing protein [Candidatus Nomurabacteria bacterium]